MINTNKIQHLYSGIGSNLFVAIKETGYRYINIKNNIIISNKHYCTRNINF